MLKVKQLVSDKWSLIQDKIISLQISNFLVIIVHCLQIGKATSQEAICSYEGKP